MPATNTPRGKTERLMNLTMCLLEARQPLPRERIRRIVEQYRSVASDDAFERMFERDKDDLRTLGIPVRTETVTVAFEDEVGYRIDPADYALPDLELIPQELAVLGLAAREWQHASLARPATLALQKLAVGADGDELARPVALLERLAAPPDPAFDPVRAACRQRRVIEFGYRSHGSAETVERRVQPWGLVRWRGRWYLTGHDLGRDDRRVFRLSRVVGEVRAVGRGGAFEVPADHDGVAMVEESFRGLTTITPSPAVLRVRAGAGHELRRRARTVGQVDDEWDLIDIDHGILDAFADEVASYGGDVVVEQPAHLREAVVRRLRASLAAHDERSGA